MSDSPAPLNDPPDTVRTQDTVPDDARNIEPPPPSIPSISIAVRGGCFASDDEARAFANRLGGVLCEVSRYIDRALASVEVAVRRLLEDLRAMADDTEPHCTMVREWLHRWAEDLAPEP